MVEFSQFKINQQKAFELKVVEHQINVKILILGADTLLSGNKSKTFAQLQQK